MNAVKKAMLDAYNHKIPEFIPYYNTDNVTFRCPTDRYLGPEKSGYDMFGVHWIKTDPSNPWAGMSPDPFVPPLLDEIENWRDITFPDLDSIDWEKYVAECLKGVNRDEVTVTALISSGLFERMNQLMGMENAMCAFYDDPDEVKEFFAALADWKLDCIDHVVKYGNPDIIQMHDDWGTNNNMFFSPEIWREFIKPHEARFARHIHSYGKIYEHHSCGYITPIIGEMIEIGIDAWNPVNVCNDIKGIKEKYGKRITLVGGFDNQRIESEDISGEALKDEIKKSLDVLAPNGCLVSYFVPLKDDLKWREVGNIMHSGLQNFY